MVRPLVISPFPLLWITYFLINQNDDVDDDDDEEGDDDDDNDGVDE